MSVTVYFPTNLESTSPRLADYRGFFKLFTKNKAYVINVGKPLRCCLQVSEMKELSVQAQDMTKIERKT
jgi:hypothetical protein